MAVKVIVPNKFYNEEYAGVKFTDGVAIFEDEQLGKSLANMLGYQVESLEAEKPKKAPAKKKAPKKEEE